MKVSKSSPVYSHSVISSSRNLSHYSSKASKLFAPSCRIALSYSVFLTFAPFGISFFKIKY